MFFAFAARGSWDCVMNGGLLVLGAAFLACCCCPLPTVTGGKERLVLRRKPWTVQKHQSDPKCRSAKIHLTQLDVASTVPGTKTGLSCRDSSASLREGPNEVYPKVVTFTAAQPWSHAESCWVMLSHSDLFPPLSPQKPRQASQAASSRFLVENLICTYGSRLAFVYVQTKAVAAAALAGIQRLFRFHLFHWG